MRLHRMRVSSAALVLPGALWRTVTLPVMTDEQIRLNLPYEFRDYLSGDPRDYVFDYALLSPPEADGERASMDLLTAAVEARELRRAREMFRRAGLRLHKAAPALCAYLALARAQASGTGAACFVDLGFQAVRMYLFQDGRPTAAREMDAGLSLLDESIADAWGVKRPLAHTYLVDNFEDCQACPGCADVYARIAEDMVRVRNYYRFLHPESRLSRVWVCGGGAAIAPLRAAIARALDVETRLVSELLPDGASAEDGCRCMEAIGAAIG